MDAPLTIAQVDSVGCSDIAVTLSDGCVLLLSLYDLLDANPRVLLPECDAEFN